MLDPLIIAVGLLAIASCGWFYVQMHRTAARVEIKEAEMGDRANLMTELADELSVANQYLYDAMDNCSKKIDGFERTWEERNALIERVLAIPAPTLREASPAPVGFSIPDGVAAMSTSDDEGDVITAKTATVPGMTSSKISSYQQGARVSPSARTEAPAAEEALDDWAADQAVVDQKVADQKVAGEEDDIIFFGPGIPQQVIAYRNGPVKQALSSKALSSKSDKMESGELEFDELLNETAVSYTQEPISEESFHPHFRAMQLAASGADMVEIARETGLGVEELRLLLRFREALSV